MQHHRQLSPKKPSIRLAPLNTHTASPSSRHMSLPPLSLSLSNSSSAPRSSALPLNNISRSPVSLTAGPVPSHNAAFLSSTATPSEIFPRIWISDLSTAENGPLLASMGITHIISAMKDHVAVPSSFIRKGGKQIQVPLDDLPFAELVAHLPRATSFMHGALSPAADPRNKVLVQCAQGVSRSVAIVCAYLIEIYGWSPSEALRFVKSKRKAANPNSGFCAQLNEYAETLKSLGTW